MYNEFTEFQPSDSFISSGGAPLLLEGSRLSPRDSDEMETGAIFLKQCRITVMRITQYEDLMAQFENPISHACDMEIGQVFTANGWEKPEGFCQSAWDTLSPFVLALSHGAQDLYEGWMKNPKSAMISCNDGFRPVTFLIEALEEEAK